MVRREAGAPHRVFHIHVLGLKRESAYISSNAAPSDPGKLRVLHELIVYFAGVGFVKRLSDLLGQFLGCRMHVHFSVTIRSDVHNPVEWIELPRPVALVGDEMHNLAGVLFQERPGQHHNSGGDIVADAMACRTDHRDGVGSGREAAIPLGNFFVRWEPTAVVKVRSAVPADHDFARGLNNLVGVIA